MQDPRQLRYQSFLIRCWEVRSDSAESPPVWRFVVRDIAEQPQERGFGSLTELQHYLASVLFGSPSLPPTSSASESDHE